MTQAPIDPKQLKSIKERFMRLSEQRFSRMLDSFNLTQSDCIKLLPLLFHVNHPMLPGYVDKSTPCGLPNYTPSTLEKKIAKTVSRSFKYKSRAYLKYEVAGLYLMGSTGTLAQSIRSDLDLWVCVSERLGQIEAVKLHQKMELISQWMETKGVELNCYLVNEEQFKRQSRKNLTKDSCGDTQNYLLLDEFYRTAIWLCGRTPLWWLVPANENYAVYSTRLLKNKHLEPLDWIDFGDINQIPAAEYFSAALWQLYKAIEAPYKSALKLLMLEIYARNFPQTGLISTQYKEKVYTGEETLEQLDPYLLVLQYAEDFLQDQPQRLEFLRRSFYLKAGAKIELDKNKPRNWRYQQLKELVEGWGWNQKRLDYLNNRPAWQINAVIDERVDLVRELNHSYHFIANFARVQGVLNQVGQNELISLGRMLYATFERRAGKIESVNTGIARDVSEPSVTLAFQDNRWQLFLGALKQTQIRIFQPVYSADSFFNLLAWCVCNRVVTRNSNYQVYSEWEFYDRELAESLVKDLISVTNRVRPELGESAFKNPAKMLKLGIYLNTESDPLKADKDSGIYSLTNLEDGFCWGENRVNLFTQFDIFWINSWGEYGANRYAGDFAWIQFFIEYRDVLTTDEDCIELYGRQLPGMKHHKKRLFQLLRQWNKLQLDSRRKHRTSRFLMSIDGQYLKIDFFDKQVEYKVFHHAKRLLNSLGENLRGPIQYQIDDNLALPQIVIRIINKPLEDNYQCYLLQNGKTNFSVLIRDPQGSVYYQVHQGTELNHLVNHYQQFFDSITHRLGFMTQDLIQIDYWFADISDSEDNTRLKRLKPNPANISNHYISTQAIATRNSEGKIRFDLYAEQQGYHFRDYGELVYQQLVKYILAQRAKNSRYPIFITNIDLSAVVQQASVMDYLTYKRIVEQKLAHTMAQHSE